MRFLKMLWKCITVWSVKPATEEELRSADVIIALSDSKMRDGSLGPGNEVIGSRVLMDRCVYGLPVIAQEEAALAAQNMYVEHIHVISGTQDGKSHLKWNTAIIFDRALEICKKKGYKKPIIVTIPDHMPRCVWHAEKRGLLPRVSWMPEGGKYYDKNLALWSCRGGSFRFRFRDFLVRITFLLTGDI